MSNDLNISPKDIDNDNDNKNNGKPNNNINSQNNPFINNTFAFQQCLLPDQIRIYQLYVILLIITLLIIFSHEFVKIRRTTKLLPMWYQNKQANLILFTGKYWKSAGKALFHIAEIAILTYSICWIWFLI